MDENDLLQEPAADSQELPSPAYEGPELPKKSPKGLIIGVFAAIVAAALCIAAILVLNSPSARLGRAAKKTGTAFVSQFEAMPNLKEAAAVYANLSQQEHSAANFRLSLPLQGEDTLLVETGLALDRQQKRADLRLSLGLQDVGSLRADAAMGDRDLQLQLPQLLPNRVLTLNLSDLGAPEDMHLFPDAAPDANALTEAMQNYAKSIQVKKDGKETVEGQTWTRFLLIGDAQKKEALIQEFSKLLTGAIKAGQASLGDTLNDDAENTIAEMEADLRRSIEQLSDPVVYVNEQGYVSGIRICQKDSTSSVALLLLGGKEPWSLIRMTADDETQFTVTTTREDASISTKFSFGENSFTMSYNDGDSTWKLDLHKLVRGLKLEGTLAAKGRDLALTGDVKLPMGLPSVHIEAEALAQAPEALSLTGTQTPISALVDPNSPEKEAIMAELQQNLLTNPEVLPLVIWLMGSDFADLI